jgi:hypothetical protein
MHMLRKILNLNGKIQMPYKLAVMYKCLILYLRHIQTINVIEQLQLVS